MPQETKLLRINGKEITLTADLNTGFTILKVLTDNGVVVETKEGSNWTPVRKAA